MYVRIMYAWRISAMKAAYPNIIELTVKKPSEY
jgi:hypothetical protein